MATPAQHVALLKKAYRKWHTSKGQNTKVWLDLVADNVEVRSLAEGKPGASFAIAVKSRQEFQQYFDNLARDWEMVHYTTGTFIAQGNHVAMLGSTSWTNRRTGRRVDTMKADFWTFRRGKAVEFTELYDTAAVVVAAT